MLERKDLDELLDFESWPAVSLYLPTHVAGREIRQDSIRLKNLLVQASERLASRLRRAEIETLLAPARGLLADEEFWRRQASGLALFLAPEFSRIHKLPLSVAEEALIGARFHIRPLLAIVDEEGVFRLLTISAARTRLFRGSRWTMTEITDLDLPQGVEALSRITEYERSQTAAPTGRRAAGLDKAQGLGDSPQELRKTLLIELLRRIAAVIEPRIAGDSLPLVLAADREIDGHFREVARWRGLRAEGIAENPDAMSLDGLRQRAYRVIATDREAQRERELGRLRALLGTGDGKVTTRPEEIVKAAHHSRVDMLFLAGGDHLWGSFDAARDAVVAHGNPAAADFDLLDYAAAMTLRQGGRIARVEPPALPPAARAAAILRY
jgi:hypothetical protein